VNKQKGCICIMHAYLYVSSCTILVLKDYFVLETSGLRFATLRVWVYP